MANVKILFNCNSDDGTIISCSAIQHTIYIYIESFKGVEHIILDKSTAIKLAKTLRTEINKIKE